MVMGQIIKTVTEWDNNFDHEIDDKCQSNRTILTPTKFRILHQNGQQRRLLTLALALATAQLICCFGFQRISEIDCLVIAVNFAYFILFSMISALIISHSFQKVKIKSWCERNIALILEQRSHNTHGIMSELLNYTNQKKVPSGDLDKFINFTRSFANLIFYKCSKFLLVQPFLAIKKRRSTFRIKPYFNQISSLFAWFYNLKYWKVIK